MKGLDKAVQTLVAAHASFSLNMSPEKAEEQVYKTVLRIRWGDDPTKEARQAVRQADLGALFDSIETVVTDVIKELELEDNPYSCPPPQPKHKPLKKAN